MMKKLLLVTSCVMLLAILPARGQQSRMFTVNEGLSSSLVVQLLESRDGMIWIATECGLSRYNGVGFTTYKHIENDPHSLGNNYVSCVFEDSRGRLFVCTYQGIQLYDPETDTFSAPIPLADGTPYQQSVWKIIEYGPGVLLTTGMQLLEIHTNSEGKLYLAPSPLPVPKNELTDYIAEDIQGNLWVALDNTPILRVNPEDNSAKAYFLSQPDIFINLVTSDSHGNLYAGCTDNSIYAYNPQEDNFHKLPTQRLKLYDIREIHPLPDGNLLLGTDGEGLKQYDSQTQVLTNFTHPNLNQSIDQSKIHSILTDHNGNLWLGIYQKGILLIPATTNHFEYAGHNSLYRNNIGSSSITALCRDKEGMMWVGTDGEGLYRIVQDNPATFHYPPAVGSSTAPPATILSLTLDSYGRMWFGSFSKGMGYFDSTTGQCTYLTRLVNPDGSRVQRVYDIVEDNQKKLWIATLGSGLFCYDMTTEAITHFPNPDNTTDVFINCLYFDGGDKLYVGSYQGLLQVDISTGQHPTFHKVFEDQIIYTIEKDTQGTLWAGTLDGLYSFEPVSGNIQHYTSENGLASDAVYGICDEGNGTLWISTDNGLSRFNWSTGEFSNFYQYDGLQGNEFCKNASFKDKDNYGSAIWFGGSDGITFFFPDQITDTPITHNVRITDFYVNSLPITKSSLSGRKSIIDTAVYHANKFHLAYQDNSFSIDLATLNYATQSRVTYRYSIDGGRWVNLPHRSHTVTFSSMSAGKHTLTAGIVPNFDNVSVDRTVTIRIAQPLWASWWAIVGYLMVALASAILVIALYRQRRLADQQALEFEKAKELQEAKQQFFFNISHEIRTPMSLITSPLQQLMKTDDDLWHQRTYRTIYRNVERILRLVNQLMDARKVEKGLMLLRFRQMEFVGFLEDIKDTFTQQALARDIVFSFEHPQIDELRLWIDPVNFDKVLMNLLSNAFKYTPNGGKITLSLRVQNNRALLQVADTGPGIPDSDKTRIYDRFYQVHTPNFISNQGTGIGLNLAKSLVELHHGELSVADNNPHGALFTVSLPLGNAHLNPDQIDSDDYYNARYGLAPAPDGLPSPSKLYSKTKYHLLIVEDDEEICEYLQNQLSSTYHVKTASNGKEALEIILKESADLVITDVMMPIMDGIELCHKIKTNVNINHIPVVLLTAKTEDSDKVTALGIGADAYITKPFNFDILCCTISNVLKNRNILKNVYTGAQEQKDKLAVIEAKSHDDKLMERVIKSINTHLSNPDITVEEIATEVGISRMQLHRKMKELTSQSTSDFIRNVRLKQAAALLAQKKYSIAEVTYLTGFSNPNNFSTAFKQLYGVPPSKYMPDSDKK